MNLLYPYITNLVGDEYKHFKPPFNDYFKKGYNHKMKQIIVSSYVKMILNHILFENGYQIYGHKIKAEL